MSSWPLAAGGYFWPSFAASTSFGGGDYLTEQGRGHSQVATGRREQMFGYWQVVIGTRAIDTEAKSPTREKAIRIFIPHLIKTIDKIQMSV